jgi:parvulin-like peptidyl-prolyl isomerase
LPRPLRRAFLLVSLALGLVIAGCGGGGSDSSAPTTTTTAKETVPPGDIAVVGGAGIPKNEFDSLLEQAKRSYASQKKKFPQAGSPEYQAIKSQATQLLVQLEEFTQGAKDLGIEVTDGDVSKRLDDVKQQYFGGSQKKYLAQLKKQGLTEGDVLRQLRLQVLQDRIYAKVTSDVKVSDADLRKYYEENKSQFKVPETRDVRHILVKTKAQAEKLYEQLQKGANFAQLAKQYSTDTGSKDQGGVYKAVQKGQFVKEFDQYLFSAKTDQLSKPIKTQFGWHIIQPTSDVKPASVASFAKVKDQIRQQVEQQKKQQAVSTWVSTLQRRYAGKIAYAVGYGPSAAAGGAHAGTAATTAASTSSP